MATTKFLALLELEDLGVESKSDGSTDAVRRYMVSGGWQVEGEIYFSSRPSQLEENLKKFFRTEDPLMKKSGGVVPAGAARTYVSSATSSGVSTQQVQPNGSVRRVFLTRDPIYKEPEGSVSSLVKDIGKTVLGTEGAPTELLGDLLDEIISPRKRQV